MMRRVPVWSVVAAIALFLGGAGVLMSFRDVADADAAGLDTSDADWETIVADAQGQTVRLWMWGGEASINDYIDHTVVPAAAEAGVTLERVPINDTATAMARLVAEADRETDAGAIDLLWVNGKNFEQGKEAGIWLEDWVRLLPNAALLDPEDPTLWNDFGVPTDGQEVPWSRAAFVFAYDTATLDQPPRSFVELLAYARAHPGRVTYPAPPDFAGSAFVRQAVQALGEEEAFDLLTELDPFLWRGGENYPVDQVEVERLFAAGELDLAMSYNPNFVDVAVSRGSFSESVEPFVFSGGTLSNVSFLAIPARAPSPEGALVVADLMLGTELQNAKFAEVGIPSVLGPELVPVEATNVPHRLVDFGSPLEELPANRVPEIDRRWLDEIG